MATQDNEKLRKANRGLAAASASAIALQLVAQACTPAPLPPLPPKSASTTSTQTNQTLAQAAMGAKISFRWTDFYTLTAPDSQTNCAGDARILYDPIALQNPNAPSPSGYQGFGVGGLVGVTGTDNLQAAAGVGTTGAIPFPRDTFDPTHTIRPAFIKNISVDLTDANVSAPQNLAYACSLGNSSNVPPVSSCATFDYGAIGGIPTTMGGTVLLMGGINGYNFAGRLPASTQAQIPFAGMSVACGQVTDTSQGIAGPTGTNVCPGNMYALAVNALPGSVVNTDPSLAPGLLGTVAGTSAISTWANLSGTSGYSGPRGAAGSAVAYDPGTQQILLFGGIAPLNGMTSSGYGSANYDTWIYNLKKQKWFLSNPTTVIDPGISSFYDVLADVSGNFVAYQQPLKPSGSRSLMGYVAVPGMALVLNAEGTSYSFGTVGASMIDKTDRIVIVGGYGGSPLVQSNRFNPTFGPELMDLSNVAANSVSSVSPAVANGIPIPNSLPVLPTDPVPRLWADSYTTQLLSNTYGFNYTHNGAAGLGTNYPGVFSSQPSIITPDYPPLQSANTDQANLGIAVAAAPLVNNAGGSGLQGTGYVLMAGGFDMGLTANTGATPAGPLVNCQIAGKPSIQCGGTAMIMGRRGDTPTGTLATERSTGPFSAVTNLYDSSAAGAYPIGWLQLAEPDSPTAANTRTVPWYGGASMHPGFNMNNNEVVYFGGADCKQYLTDPAAPCSFSTAPNPGRYWRFGSNPVAGVGANMAPDQISARAGPTGVNTWTNAPINAGMASARGLDPGGHVIILAWGGMMNNTIIDSSQNIYLLYNAGTVGAPNPTWTVIGGLSGFITGNLPVPLANSQMVFSHVTRKFYLFGGYSPLAGSVSSMYELTINAAPGTRCDNTGNCSFYWKQLDGLAQYTCYPNCPSARRSHRMAEVDYNNNNPGGANAALGGNYQSGEQDCTGASPCSYGIFMEGGTSDGLSFLSDRWMFDPTANGGGGHWQLVNDFPPRALASTAAVDYYVTSRNANVHRAVLFGGETGMEDAAMAVTGVSSPISGGMIGSAMVPPTLGDTWMYDFDSNTWNRVQLLGKGYNQPNGGAFNYANLTALPLFQNELERRQAFDVTGATNAWGLSNSHEIAELSPPPLAGAFMVTRPPHLPTGGLRAFQSPQNPGGIPEVFLFGGRTKDGRFNPLDHVYKFCAGSTGEAFDPGTFAPSATDFGCDAYDATLNDRSPNPSSGYVGRWLRKIPLGSNMPSSQRAAFLGAGAYDPVRDLIIVFGGLRAIANPATTAVTDSPNVVTSSELYEYTPPSPAAGVGREGAWKYVQSCTPSAPAGRYGHAMGYDALHQEVILVGGYDANGNPLVTNLTYPLDGRQYSIPEVWSGKFYGSNYTPPPGSQDTPITNAPCYLWTQITVFGNSIDIPSSAPPTGGVAHAASIYVPSSGYNTGYYSMFDNACEKAGPIASPDPAVNKLMAGGAYFDIDRTVLGPGENLLLNLTFIPLGTNNIGADGSQLTTDEVAAFNIHLVRTGSSGDSLRSVLQPRYLQYSAVDQFPQVVQTLSVMAPPTGEIRQEQYVLPISIDPGIDRIRIERYSGSAILIDASLFRMGGK